MSRTRPPKAVRSILYIHWKLRYYPSNNPMNYLATNVTKKLDHNRDEDTAVKVGSRHGKPVIYKVAAGNMERAGFASFLSVNGVWLTKEVPKEYLIKME